MTDNVSISYDAFFGTDHQVPEFAALVQLSLETKRGLIAKDRGGDVLVELSDPANGQKRPTVYGEWRSPDFHGVQSKALGTNLLLPILFRSHTIELSPEQIYTMGRTHGSICDFFARNFLFALTVDRVLSVIVKPIAEKGGAVEKQFRRNYYFILKRWFPESAFSSRNAADAIDLIMANSYLCSTSFRSGILTRGFSELRQHTERGRSLGIIDEGVPRIAACRASLMELIA